MCDHRSDAMIKRWQAHAITLETCTLRKGTTKTRYFSTRKVSRSKSRCSAASLWMWPRCTIILGMSYTYKGDYENALLQHHKSLEIKLRIYGNKQR